MRSLSTRSARLKRYAFNLLLAAVYIGAPVFAAMALYPVVVDWRDRTEELGKAQRALSRWLRAVSLPTQTRIEAERAYTAGMRMEYDRARSYYQLRNVLLDRNLLDTYTGDPVQVKLKYQRLKLDLESKGNYQQAKDIVRKPLLPAYAWEEPAQRPRREDFQAIQRKACIADALVELLSSAGSCAIGHLSVKAPFDPEAEAGTGETPPAPEEEEATGDGSRYVLWPVELEFVAAFSNVGVLLDKLATSPSKYPALLIHSLRVEGLDRNRALVIVGLNVLDFG